jgi:hypothetical protein
MIDILERWRKPYVIQLVGSESGNATTLDFLRFRTDEDAQEWVATHDRSVAGLTFYRVIDTRVAKR